KFGERLGDYTLNFRIPMTNNNNKVLGFINDLQNSKSFYYQDYYRAKVIADGNLLIEGYMYLLSIDKINKAYEITVISSNISFSEILSRKFLSKTNLTPILYSGVKGSDRLPWIQNEPDTTAIHQIWPTNEEDNLYDFNIPFVNYGNFFSGEITFLDDCDFTAGSPTITVNNTTYNVYQQVRPGMKVSGKSISQFAAITSVSAYVSNSFTFQINI